MTQPLDSTHPRPQPPTQLHTGSEGEQRGGEVAADAAPAVDPDPGGTGGESIEPLAGAREARMIERAIRQRWPISDEFKLQLLNRLEKHAQKPKISTRALTSIARTVTTMEAQNQGDQHKDRPDVSLELGLTPEQIASMSDEELHETIDRLNAAARRA